MTALETFEVDGLTVEIHADDTGDSPRGWDNCAVLACEHSRYNLGDGTLADAIGRSPGDFRSAAHLERYLRLCHGAIAVKPLYLYDHSGISMSTGSFEGRAPHAAWDSGLVGVAWITRETAEREGTGDRVAWAERCIDGEVEVYDQYLRGDVYGYVVETPAGDVLESLWGMYGWDYCRSEAEAMAALCASQEADDAAWAASQEIPTLA